MIPDWFVLGFTILCLIVVFAVGVIWIDRRETDG